ncbi:recombinase family protein [Nonomuraea sp. NPDC048882]|uniref:recombinase family protein n=1 Tax=Nonomuraea sp. NPDC048882 TaxID=3154347 RepID=UPI0034003E33
MSTADQNLDHQIDALMRAGVARENIHLDRASGAKASRPKARSRIATAALGRHLEGHPPGSAVPVGPASGHARRRSARAEDRPARDRAGPA